MKVKEQLRRPTLFVFVYNDKILGKYISKEEDFFNVDEVKEYRDIHYTECEIYVRVRE